MQVGVKCVLGDIKWDSCHVCRKNPLRPCNTDLTILDLIERNPVKEAHRTRFSPSKITGCDRQYHLMRKQPDYYEDISNAYPAVRGTMIHAILEKAGDVSGYEQTFREITLKTSIQIDSEEVQLEQNFNPTDQEREVGAEPFNGTADLILVKSTLPALIRQKKQAYIKIVDYKSSEIDHSLVSARPEHIMQINLYKWMAKRCADQFLGDVDVLVDELEIIYLSQKRTRRFTSAGPMRDRGKLVDRANKIYEPITLAPIPVVEDSKVEEWLIRRIKERKQAESILPPILTGEKSRMCWYCPIREKCFELERKGNDGRGTD
jgi:hypothetical protein